MDIPGILKFLRIKVDIFKKEFLKKPELVRIATVKMMQVFQTQKESTPWAYKLFSYINPQPLNSLIVGGSIWSKWDKNKGKSKCVTHDPHMYDARPGPLTRIMYIATPMFSPPLSPRTRLGQPKRSTASTKSPSTVEERLLSTARMLVI